MAGRIWCVSSLVVAVKARAIITFTSYWPASADGTCEGRTSHQLEHFQTRSNNYIIFTHQNCQKVNPIWYPQQNLQCFWGESKLHRCILRWFLFGCHKKFDRSHLWIHKKNEATLHRDVDFRCKMLVWKLSWKSWKEPMRRKHVMKVDEAFDSGHNYR